MEGSQTSQRHLGLLWGAVAASLLLLATRADEFAQTLRGCSFKSFLGLPCPTCGVTRAALELSNLDVASALRINPLATVLMMVLVLGGLVAGVSTFAGHPPQEPRWDLRPVERLGLLLVIVANWAYLVANGT
jgi:hypothetical protein